MDELNSTISADFLDYQYEVLGITSFLKDPDVTEICINRPGEVFLETSQGWKKVEVNTLNLIGHVSSVLLLLMKVILVNELQRQSRWYR